MLCTLTRITQETKDVKGFRFRLERPFSFIPGQYVMLSIDGMPMKRAFSIVDYNKDANELYLLIKLHGEFTARLFCSKEGDNVNVFGPFGRFVLADDKRPAIFIAGGIGITPLYNMMKAELEKINPRYMQMHYSSKKREDVLLYDELKNMGTRFYLTRENVQGFIYGHITPEEIARSVKEIDGKIYYICGPDSMIEEMRMGLEKLGVAASDIKSESFT